MDAIISLKALNIPFNSLGSVRLIFVRQLRLHKISILNEFSSFDLSVHLKIVKKIKDFHKNNCTKMFSTLITNVTGKKKAP